jgi:geranylgeranyl diphosphate synthase type I
MRLGQDATHVALAGGDAHHGISSAILAGDLALVLADELFCEAGFPPDRFLAAFRWFNRMRIEVLAGQYLDLAASRGLPPRESTVRRIARLKSGGYTVEKPLLIGASLAGATPDIETTLSAYGSKLGEAFQIQDDVLGAFGDPAETGKDALGDLREGKRTLLVSRALEASSEADRAFIGARLGSPDLTGADADRIRDIMRSTGALSSTLGTVGELRAEALEALAGADLDAPVVFALTELSDLVVARRS